MTTPHDWASPDDPPAAPTGAGWQAPPGWGGPPPSPPSSPPPAARPPSPPPGAWGPPQGYGAPYGAPSGHGVPGGWGSPAWGAPRPPEVKPGIVPLRPLGLGELLDGSVTLVRRYPRPTLGLSAAIALVTTLLNIPFLLSYLDSPLLSGEPVGPGSGVDLAAEFGALSGGLGAGALLSLVSSVVLAGVITAVVGRGVLGQPMSLGQAWAAVRPRLLRLIGLALLVLLLVWGVFVGSVVLAVVLAAAAGPVTLLVGIPLVCVGIAAAVHLYVRLALAPSVMVLERTGVGQSMRRSGVLVKGDWWRVFGILLLVLVITMFVSAVVQAPFEAQSFVAGFSGEPVETTALDIVLSSVGQALALTVVAPFAAAVSALLYVDRRMRGEGLDVALTAAAASPGGPATADRPTL